MNYPENIIISFSFSFCFENFLSQDTRQKYILEVSSSFKNCFYIYILRKSFKQLINIGLSYPYMIVLNMFIHYNRSNFAIL